MKCTRIQKHLGQLVDGELNPRKQALVDAHLEKCARCRQELQALQRLVQAIESSAPVGPLTPPAELWSRLEARLGAQVPQVGRRGMFRLFRRTLAAAASLMVVVGAGAFVAVWLSSAPQPAQASSIDYTILLDRLADGVDAAVNRFLDHYRAEATTLAEARVYAAHLSFDLPAQLPSGHALEQVYRLRFGDSPGLAARYRLGSEPLVVFFHPPVNRERLGVHREMPCIVGGRHGQHIEIGPWRLVHFTDPTTCHCVLSRLDMDAQLPAVLAAIAPRFDARPDGYGNVHQHE